MKDTASRVFVLMLVLVGVWVLTYWLYEPGAVANEARVTFDMPRGGGDGASIGAEHGEHEPSSLMKPPPPPPVVEAPTVEKPKVSDGTGEKVAVPVPPQFGTYIVQEGDRGWEDIAQKVYGDRSLWQVISRSNPLATPDKLIPGITKLRYALDPTNIQGRVEYVEPTPPPAPNPAPVADGGKDPKKPSTPPGTNDNGYVEHVITKDDTLWDLAKAYYGKGHMYTRILEANRDVIENERALPVGKTIKIPPMQNE